LVDPPAKALRALKKPPEEEEEEEEEEVSSLPLFAEEDVGKVTLDEWNRDIARAFDACERLPC